MNTKTEIKEIRETILKGQCSFIIRGLNNYQKLKNNSYGYAPQTFKVNEIVTYIYEANIIGANALQMNIDKITKTAIYLYTYTMLNKKVTGKIKFEDITLIN